MPNSAYTKALNLKLTQTELHYMFTKDQIKNMKLQKMSKKLLSRGY